MKRYVVVANPYRQADRMDVIKYTDSLRAAHAASSDRCRWDATGIFETATGAPVWMGDYLLNRPR